MSDKITYQYAQQTIYNLMHKIRKGEIFLPALQRKYVWTNEQIIRLMDSILRGYPIGTVVFWKVHKTAVEEKGYALYEFIRNYHEKDCYQNTLAGPLSYEHDNLPDERQKENVWAVLDGQQRLASLYVALMGSVSRKIPWKHRSNDGAYPKKELYFCISEDEEYGMNDTEEFSDDCTSPFRFFSEKENPDKSKWYLVKNLFSPTWDINKAASAFSWGNKGKSRDRLNMLHKQLCKYEVHYLELKQDTFDDVLDIFVRLNSGGTILSKSDLLFSTIVSHWDEARMKMDALLRDINKDNAFRFSIDFIMRTCLYLTGSSINLKVESFGRKSVEQIRDAWDEIENAIRKTVDLLKEFGFCAENIRSYAAVIPVVYYFFCNRKCDEANRINIRKYFILAQVNQVFGASTNTALETIRKLQTEQKETSCQFNLGALQKVTFGGEKKLSCSEERLNSYFKIENMACNFMILSLLYPDLKLNQIKFHVDHMHPYSSFDGKQINIFKHPDGSSYTQEEKENLRHRRNTLANLQLLEGSENESKNKTPLKEWLETHKNSVKYLPNAVSYELIDCEAFWDARVTLMRDELKKKLNL